MILAVSVPPVSMIVLVGTIVAFIGAGISGVVTTRSNGNGRRLGADDHALLASGLLAPTLKDRRRFDGLETAILFVLAGYLFFDKAFAWIHVPGTPAFIGEMVIAFGIVVFLGTHPRLGLIIRTSPALQALLVFMAWGALLLVLALPTWGLDAVRDAAIWYYGIIAVFVAVLMVADPGRLGRWLRLFGKAIPYMFLWFPVAIVLDAAFYYSFPVIPDSNVSIVAHRTGNIGVITASALAFLWLVDRDSEVFDRRQRTTLTVLATVIILFAATRNRGGFVSGAIVLFIAFILMYRERSNMASIMVGVSVLLVAVALFANLRIQLFEGREVSVEQFLNNIVSVVDRSAGGSRQASTTQWRIDIWNRVLDDVSTEHPVAGFGPGPDLGRRYGITTDEEAPLRNPHNSHVSVLARMGFVGLALWGFFWVAFFVEMWQLRRRLLARGRIRDGAIIVWLIASVVGILINAIFDPTLEGPQVAWWLWAFVGFGFAMSVLDRLGILPDIDLRRTTPSDHREAVAAP